jgi:polyisoprenyl-phosphate glycosyltransferase
VSTSATVRQFANFALIGVVNTSVYYGAFHLANIRLHYLAAYCISFVAAVAVSFVLNCVITYRIRPTWRGAFRFPLSSLVNLVTAGGTLQLGVSVFGLGEDLAALIGGVLVTPLSFLLARWALLPQRTAGPVRAGPTRG